MGRYFACFNSAQLGIYQFEADALKIIDSIAWPGNGSAQFSPNNELVMVYEYSLTQGLRMLIHHVGQNGILSYSNAEH
jgi:hypothetical protein